MILTLAVKILSQSRFSQHSFDIALYSGAILMVIQTVSIILATVSGVGKHDYDVPSEKDIISKVMPSFVCLI